jgi:hypothetical protein
MSPTDAAVLKLVGEVSPIQIAELRVGDGRTNVL